MTFRHPDARKIERHDTSIRLCVTCNDAPARAKSKAGSCYIFAALREAQGGAEPALSVAEGTAKEPSAGFARNPNDVAALIPVIVTPYGVRWQGHRFLRLGRRCELVAVVHARTATSRRLSKHQTLRGVTVPPPPKAVALLRALHMECGGKATAF